MSAPSHFYDVCVVCALAEEAAAVLDVFSQSDTAVFQKRFSGSNREYRCATIENNEGEFLAVHVSWPPAYGPVEMALHLKAVLTEFNPRFVAMTGICAGDKKKVKLGDLVIASRAFTYDSGKYVMSTDGRQEHVPDTDTRHIDQDALQYARMFDSWTQPVGALYRPASKRQQREWLLNELLNEVTPGVDNLDLEELRKNAPDWRRIVVELQGGRNSYLTSRRTLRKTSRIRELHFGEGDFPFKDPLKPICHIAPLASGSAVRSDNPFAEVRAPVRTTAAIDMEGAAFYRTVADFQGIRPLVVKAVSDYADPDKDDSYHKYACDASATYLHCFIKEYVTGQRMRRIGDSGTPRPQDKLLPLALSACQGKSSTQAPNAPLQTSKDRGVESMSSLDATVELLLWDERGLHHVPVFGSRRLPLRPGVRLQVEVRMSQPAHVYLFWLRTDGVVSPLYPWRDHGWKELPPALATNHVLLPPVSESGEPQAWPLTGPAGVETLLLLARPDPLPSSYLAKLNGTLVGLAGSIRVADLPDSTRPYWFTCRKEECWMDAGQGREAIRGLGTPETIHDPLFRIHSQLRERLGKRCQFIQAVSFANLGEEA